MSTPIFNLPLYGDDDTAELDTLLNGQSTALEAALVAALAPISYEPQLISDFGVGWTGGTGAKAVRVYRIGVLGFVQGTVTVGSGWTYNDVFTVPADFVPNGPTGVLGASSSQGATGSSKVLTFGINQAGVVQVDRVTAAPVAGETYNVNFGWIIN